MYLPLVVLVPLVLMFWKSFELGPREVLPSALIGQPFPAFSLPDLLEQGTLSEKLLEGRMLLVNVWGSWCVTCLDEHPLLMRLTRENIPIVGLNYKDDPIAAREWLRTHGNPYEFIIVDQDGKLGIDLGLYGAPSTFVVDEKGTIRMKQVGALNEATWESIKLEYFRP